MRTILALALCISICLSGCGILENAPETQPGTTATPTTVPTETTETVTVPYTDPLVAVATPLITEESLADDGTCIFTYSFQDFVLTMEDPVVAESITEDFLTRNDFSVSAQSVLDSAKAAYNGQSDWSGYSCSVLYDPMRLDQTILSLYGSEIIDNGSPRSTSANLSLTYDLITGNALSLQDILVQNYSAQALIDKILAAISPLSEQGVLFADYEYIITDLFSTNTPVERWFLTQDGLCFFFTPYEIAPYNAGTVMAQIPYSELVGLLKNNYFPAERIDYSGKVIAVNTADADMGAHSRFTEVILDNHGKEYLITVQGAALDVRLQIGAWDEDTFTPSYTAYAATALTTEEALLIQLSDEQKTGFGFSYSGTQPAQILP